MSFVLFTPKSAGTVSALATASSQAVALSHASTGNFQVRVYNLDSSVTAYIEFGASTVTASTATGVPIGPGQLTGFTVPTEATHVAVIGSGAATSRVYFTPGNGV